MRHGSEVLLLPVLAAAALLAACASSTTNYDATGVEGSDTAMTDTTHHLLTHPLTRSDKICVLDAGDLVVGTTRYQNSGAYLQQRVAWNIEQHVAGSSAGVTADNVSQGISASRSLGCNIRADPYDSRWTENRFANDAISLKLDMYDVSSQALLNSATLTALSGLVNWDFSDAENNLAPLLVNYIHKLYQ